MIIKIFLEKKKICLKICFLIILLLYFFFATILLPKYFDLNLYIF